jgi:tetratricopeptide (TPR) repeat protein
MVRLGMLDAALDRSVRVFEPWVTDIDLAADLVEALDAASRGAEADAFLARVTDRLDEAQAAAPGAATLYNASAWLLARTGRRLDDGLRLAQRAVALSPQHAAYIDTLAEVQFQLGKGDAALELEQEAVALEPERAFLHAQVERFRAGDPSAALPPR